jgi:hypothetical protein
MSIGLKLLEDHSPRVVMWGMSCAGKTTFAKLLTEHQYFCFDAMFNWHLIETLGLSIDTNLEHVASSCEVYEKFVIDGWHLADKEGSLLPSGVTAYVVYDDYDSIIRRYRVPVQNKTQHMPMFIKWYNLSLTCPIRFFKNHGTIVETTSAEFIDLLEHNQ